MGGGGGGWQAGRAATEVPASGCRLLCHGRIQDIVTASIFSRKVHGRSGLLPTNSSRRVRNRRWMAGWSSRLPFVPGSNGKVQKAVTIFMILPPFHPALLRRSPKVASQDTISSSFTDLRLLLSCIWCPDSALRILSGPPMAVVERLGRECAPLPEMHLFPVHALPVRRKPGVAWMSNRQSSGGGAGLPWRNSREGMWCTT